jgi:hypothetical protein
MDMLTNPPGATPRGFLDFSVLALPDDLEADIALPGVPFAMRYDTASMANERSRAPVAAGLTAQAS